MTSRPYLDMLPRQFEMAVALRQCALTAAGCIAAGLRSAGASEISLAVCRGPSRIFPGTMERVAAVRRFARSEFGEHPALDDAVFVVSELASNAVVHTASGQPGGMFLVHLATVSVDHVAILVTDQGSATEPRAKHSDVGDESGRGLAVVTKLATLLVSYGDDTVRSMLAMIGGKSPCTHKDMHANQLAWANLTARDKSDADRDFRRQVERNARDDFNEDVRGRFEWS